MEPTNAYQRNVGVSDLSACSGTHLSLAEESEKTWDIIELRMDADSRQLCGQKSD